MGNVFDYLKWRGDLSITKDNPFNEVDSLILARFSYFPFDKINLENGDIIESIAKKMRVLDTKDFAYHDDKELIDLLGISTRFKYLMITDYVKNADKSIDKQFGAITIHLNNKELYISYIGTDNTINGWKEDFNMSFMDNVPCQISGKEYIDGIFCKYKDKKVIIGGHSKGGNVAIYSSITQRNNNRIINVYNFDGPGLGKNIINNYKNKKIISKIKTYIPQDSIIGRLLNHPEEITIIKSSNKSIMEHNIYSWQIENNHFVYLENNTRDSDDIDKAVNEWLEVTTNEQRKIFIDTIFELLYSTGANTFKDMSKNVPTKISGLLKKYSTISREDKKTINEMISIIINKYISIITEHEKDHLNDIREEYSLKVKTAIKEIKSKYKMKREK